MSKGKIPLGMTVEEFEEHLKMMNDRVINFKEYGGSVVGTKLDRRYNNQKRGNFHGNGNFLRTVKVKKDRMSRIHRGKHG